MRYILGFFVVSALALTVQAQAENPAADRPAGSGMEMKGGQMGMDKMGMGKMMNMPAEMQQRCRMMMQTAINPGDPAAILAIKDDLKLTPEQVQKIQAIADEARKEAKGVLDEQQAKMLQAIPAKPETPMAMHQQMMQKMKDMPAGQGGQMPMMNCPMMKMMDGGGATTQPAQDKPTAP